MQVLRHARLPSPKMQVDRYQSYMDWQSGADNAEGSGSGEFERKSVSKKQKSLTIKIDRSKVEQSTRIYDDVDDMIMDDLEAVNEERKINRAKVNGKGRLVGGGKEHMREQATDSHAYKVDFTLPSTRPRPKKTKQREKDGNANGARDYGRRSGGSDNKDTTVRPKSA